MLGEFNAQSLANAVCAFAKLGMQEQALLEAGSSRPRELGEFTSLPERALPHAY